MAVVPTSHPAAHSVSELSPSSAAGAALKWNRAPSGGGGPAEPASQLIFTVNVAWERNNGIDVKWGISKLNAKNV